jgi:hypothetical protein
MKSAPDNSALDAFIKETLKASDSNLQPFDWSEVEVLLRHEKKSISVGVDKKTITYIGAGLVVLMILLGIFKIVQHYSSLPAEPETSTDSTQNTLNATDTVKTAAPAVDSVLAKHDTVKIDTTHLVPVINIPKPDSTKAIVAPVDTTTKGKVFVTPKQDKKKKPNTVKDTGATKKDSILPPAAPVDTTSTHPMQEIKIENPSPAVDTSTKNAPAPKSNSKNKKGKTKKGANPSPNQLKPAEMKSDSLKQQ